MSGLQSQPRFRINAKQTAKGLWQFDATVEYSDDKIKISSSEDAKDIADTKFGTLGMKLLSMIHEAEEAFRKDGRSLVSDIPAEDEK